MHFFGHGGVIASFQNVSSNLILSEFIQGLCRVAVNCFILISGYYGIDHVFKWKKVKKLWIQVWFYSVIIFAALVIFKMITPSIKDFAYALFPISTNSDEFSTELC